MDDQRLITKLSAVQNEFKDLENRLQGLSYEADPDLYLQTQKRYAELKEIIDLAHKLNKIREDQKSLEAMLKEESQSEILELINEEIRNLEAEKNRLELELFRALLPEDPDDNKDIFLEIRAGTGGDEACLFAGDLFRCYSKFCDNKGWKLEVVDFNENPIGGFKEIIASIKGHKVYKHLKFESGVHRVQRIPKTEASGRIHTSTVTVAVLPEVEEKDVVIDPKDLKIESFRASGAGGQYVNTTDSAVRITHLPTGLVVSIQDERSQHKNREKALKVLRAKLYEKQKAETEAQIKETRRKQVGTGERSEKIRTYNFPQNRVTDHRINKSWHNLDLILEGELDEIIDSLLLESENFEH
jgi:peptide chain release factor 1